VLRVDAGGTELLEVPGADEGIVLDVSSYPPNGVTDANTVIWVLFPEERCLTFFVPFGATVFGILCSSGIPDSSQLYICAGLSITSAF